jgi:hypothetical protein
MHLETFRQFPPLQAAATYNLDEVMTELRAGTGHPHD